MPAEMIPLTSSNLAAAGLDPESDYPLVIEFASGATYAYPGTEDDLSSLQSAPSPGAYFMRNIKSRPFRRIS